MKPPNVLVRKLTDSDVDGYRSLRLLSLQTDPNAFHLRYSSALAYPLSYFRSEMNVGSDKVYGFYGAFIEGILIGMVALQAVGKDTAQIFTLYVHPGHQRMGVGTALVTEVINTAIAARVSVLCLSVIEGNSAISLYESLGFEMIEKKRGVFKSNQGLLDELVYQRKLSNL